MASKSPKKDSLPLRKSASERKPNPFFDDEDVEQLGNNQGSQSDEFRSENESEKESIDGSEKTKYLNSTNKLQS